MATNDLETPPKADIADFLTKTRPHQDPKEKKFILDVIEKTLRGGSLLVMTASDIIRRLCFLYVVAAYFLCHQFQQLPILFISPLVALIEKKGMLFRNEAPLSLRVSCLYEGAKIRQIMKQVENTKVDVLLLTPEMLEKILLSYKLPPISFACIDNAECVLKLQTYRPTYLRLNKLLKGLVGFRFLLGLSALATESTTASLMKQFEFEEIISGSHLTVIPRNIQPALCSDEDGKRTELIGLLNQKDVHSIIVVCDSGDSAESVFEMVQEHFSLAFAENADIIDTEMNGKRRRSGGHQEVIKTRKLKTVKLYLSATMSSSEKKVVRDGFESDQIDIVVTTLDFGMGLTKADAIIYYCMPQTYESLGWAICHVPRKKQPQGYVYVLLDKQENYLEKFRCSTMKLPNSYTIQKQVQAIFKGEFKQEKGINDGCFGFILASLESDDYLELPSPISDCHHLKEGYRQPNQHEMKSICKTLRTRLVEQATSSVEVFKQLCKYLTSSDNGLDRDMLARKFSYGEQSASPSAIKLVGLKQRELKMGTTQERKIEELTSTHQQQSPQPYSSQATATATDILGPETGERLDKKPKLKELQLMKTSDGKKVKIMDSIASKWQAVGNLMDFDAEGVKLKLIAADKTLNGPVDCCLQMFMHWLDGNGPLATWRVLIEVLEDCDLNDLANQIRDALKICC